MSSYSIRIVCDMSEYDIMYAISLSVAIKGSPLILSGRVVLYTSTWGARLGDVTDPVYLLVEGNKRYRSRSCYQRLPNTSQAFTIQAAFFNLVTGFAKLSILLFYRQLSPQRWWRWSVHTTSLVVVGYCIALLFAVLFACNPISKAWDVTMTGGSCIDIVSVYKATAFFGIFTDLVLLVLPFPLVLNLQMKTPQKVGIIFVFVIGSV